VDIASLSRPSAFYCCISKLLAVLDPLTQELQEERVWMRVMAGKIERGLTERIRQREG